MTALPETLDGILRLRAQEAPDRAAFVFLREGDEESEALTFAQLETKARAIAAHLQEYAGQQPAVALLLFPQGLDFVAALMGCFYAGVVAVPGYPPDRVRLARSLPRLKVIAQDAGAGIVLTTRDVLDLSEEIFSHTPELRSLKWIATDGIPVADGASWSPGGARPNEVAYLQYTSGSTSTPKGVMVSHQNVIQNMLAWKPLLGVDESSVCVTWLPMFHDLGLMDSLCLPQVAGCASVILPPVAFLQRPIRWLRAITKYRGTHSSGPNFAFDLCSKKISEDDRAALDLSSLHSVTIAAEPVRQSTVERFIQTFGPCGFAPRMLAPGFGLAEATLAVSTSPPEARPRHLLVDAHAIEHHEIVEVPASHPNARAVVACGAVVPGTEVAVVHPESRCRVAENQVGEIWISGPGVALGYWRRAEATSTTFQATIANEPASRSYLRTGDLGFIRGGELFVTGRHKDLIIIRGRNHYPQDIELTVERAHPAIRPGCSAAFPVTSGDEERLVMVVEVERRHLGERRQREGGPAVGVASRSGVDRRQVAIEPGHEPDARVAVDLAGLRKRLTQAIAEEHELMLSDILFLNPGTVPKTSSGKIQRHACRLGYLEKTLDCIEGA